MTDGQVKKGRKTTRLFPYAYVRRGLKFELESAVLDGERRAGNIDPNNQLLRLDAHDWHRASLEFAVSVKSDVVQKVLPRPKGNTHPVRFLVAKRCDAALLREGELMDPATSALDIPTLVRFEIERDRLRDSVEFVPFLVRTKTEPDIASGYAREIGARLADGREWTVRIDRKARTRSQHLDINYIKFSDQQRFSDLADRVYILEGEPYRAVATPHPGTARDCRHVARRRPGTAGLRRPRAPSDPARRGGGGPMRFGVLHRLRDEGRSLVSDEFMRGETESVPTGEVEPYLEAYEPALELDELDRVVDELIAEFPRYAPEMDAEAGPRLYAALPLDRRSTSDPGIWRFLAVVHRPDFVRHRWEFASRASTLPRYWQFGTRPNSNAFGRLWWITRLSSNDGDYRYTRTLLKNRALANNLFVRSFSRYGPLVVACCEVLADAGHSLIEEVLPRLNSRLSTIVLEGRSQGELVELVRQIRERVERSE